MTFCIYLVNTLTKKTFGAEPENGPSNLNTISKWLQPKMKHYVFLVYFSMILLNGNILPSRNDSVT